MKKLEPTMETLLRGRQFKRALDQLLAPLRAAYGLRPVESEILYYVATRGGATPTEVCHSLVFTKGHVSQAMDALRREGYLTAQTDQEDRRRVTFQATEAAQAVIADLEKARMEIVEALLEGVSEEELLQAGVLWEKLFVNIERMLVSGQKTGQVPAAYKGVRNE